MSSARSVAAANALLVLVVAAAAGLPWWRWSARAAEVAPLKKDAAALQWQPVALASPDALLVPPPPPAGSLALLQELWATAQARGRVEPPQITTMTAWNKRPVALPWLEFLRDRLSGEGTREATLREARAVAWLGVVIYDAQLVALRARAKYGRQAPARVAPFMVGTLGEDDGNPSYPSSHATAGWAAATAIADLLPDAKAEATRMAEEAGDARLAGGFCYPSDVAAGKALGIAVARKIAATRQGAGEAEGQVPWLRKRTTTGPLPAGDGPIARFAGENPGAAWLRHAVDAVESHNYAELLGARLLAYAGMAQADAAIAGAEAYPRDPALVRVVVAACAAEFLGDVSPADERRFDALAERVEQASGAPPALIAAARELGRKVAVADRRAYFFELERRDGY